MTTKRIRKGTYKLELNGIEFMIRKEGSLGWTLTAQGYYKGHSLDEAHEKDTTKKGCIERAINIANNLKDNPSAYSY